MVRYLIDSIRIAICLLLPAATILAQTPTVGVLTASPDMAPGYSLFAPNATKNTYLIDNCGQVIQQWGNSNYFPGSAVYLKEDGSLIRTCRVSNSNFVLGGLGGRVEHWSWNDSLLWSFNFSTTSYTQHHDIEPLPNGNVLLLAVEQRGGLDPQVAGRNPALLSNGEVWTDFVVEIEPIGPDSGAVVWEWHAWDHLVQDYSNTANNYGVVAEHPELIDLNFVPGLVSKDWLHTNAIAYNADLDQIAISVGHFNEIWLIDHSTTTAESGSHSGGQRQKGGDLLYRWGNPTTYQRGDSSKQKLYFQHNVHWVPNGYPNAGKLLIFNNGVGRNWSSAEMVTPPESSPGNYSLTSGQAYGPLIPDRSYATDSMLNFFTRFMGSVQQQKNGNWLLTHAARGYAIEVDTNGNKVWQYKNPTHNGGTTIQGNIPSPGINSIFRLERYAPDFPGFAGKDLSPSGPLEIGSDLTNCITILTETPTPLPSFSQDIFPNPVQSTLYLNNESPKKVNFRILSIQGQIQAEGTFSNHLEIDVSTWLNGIYFIQIDKKAPFKLVKLSN